MVILFIMLLLFWFGCLVLGIYSMTRDDWKKPCKKCQQHKRAKQIKRNRPQ